MYKLFNEFINKLPTEKLSEYGVIIVIALIVIVIMVRKYLARKIKKVNNDIKGDIKGKKVNIGNLEGSQIENINIKNKVDGKIQSEDEVNIGNIGK